MEKLSNVFSMLTDTGADLQLDEIFIIIFVSLVVLALLLGYLVGRKVSAKGDKKQAKADKKLAKERAKADKEAAKLEKEAKKADKKAKKEKKNKDEQVDWFDTDNIDDDKPSSMPIIPERTTTTFIDTNSENRVESRPVVSAPMKRQKQQPTSPKHAAASKAELKQRAQAEADARKVEEERQKNIDREEQRAAAVAATLQAKASQQAEEQTEEPKLSKREQKKLEKEQARLEKEQAKAAKAAEPKLSKKEQKKLKKAEEEGLANTVIVEAAPTDSTVTAEEMAKRLESIMGTAPTGTISLGAAEEEEVPADQIGKIQSTQIEGRHNDNWVLEEAQRQNEEADRKEAERKEKDALPFAFGSDIEGSADDVQLSYKARKKLREEEEKKAQEEEQKKEKKHISIFAKRQEQETVVEEEDDFFDENYMGEEIPDSLAGFGFSAAPSLDVDDEDKKSE